MAFGNETDVQLRPELATNRTPIDFGVEQSAAAHLADAFRQGLVNADDIIERYGTLAKSKEKMQIQGIDEFIHPDAIQARQSQVRAAKIKADFDASPEVQATNEAVLQDTKNKAMAGDDGARHQFLVGLGFDDGFTPEEGYTPERRKVIAQKFSDAVAFDRFRKLAELEVKSITPQTDEISEESQEIVGGQLSNVKKKRPRKPGEIWNKHVSGRAVPDETYNNLRASQTMSPEEWILRGRPSGPYMSGATEPASPAPLGTVKTTEKKTVTANGDTTETKTTETPVVANPSGGKPVVTDELPASSISITPITPKPVNESTSKAKLATAKFTTSNEILDYLKGQNFDATGKMSAVNKVLPHLLRFGEEGDNRTIFETARNLWQQGLLRLESGAQISPGEKTWYNSTFFPEFKDSPALVEFKANARHEVEAMVAELAAPGEALDPKEVRVLWQMRQLKKGGSQSVAPGGEVRQPLLSGKGEIIKRGGRYTIGPSSVTPKPQPAPAYSAPSD